MEKKNFERFIKKYNLGGLSTRAVINYKNGSLYTKFKTDVNDLFGMVKVDNIDLNTDADESFGIFNTNLILKVLSALGNEIELNLIEDRDELVSLRMSDNTMTSDLLLADLDVLDDPPEINELPNFGVNVPLNSVIADSYIKAKNALPDCNTVSFVSKDGKLYMIFNYSTSQNTDNIKIEIEPASNVSGDFVMTFNADTIKEIIVANNESCIANLRLSTAGLCEFSFSSKNNFAAKYYVVMLQN